MGYTIAYLHGYVCLASSESCAETPTQCTTYWPFFMIPEKDIEDYKGLDAVGGHAGIYTVRVHGTGLARHLQLRDGAHTRPLAVVCIPIPCPPVRAGIPVRWMNGRWEKQLKAQGWIPVEERTQR